MCDGIDEGIDECNCKCQVAVSVVEIIADQANSIVGDAASVTSMKLLRIISMMMKF
jgi:hypothetical protein